MIINEMATALLSPTFQDSSSFEENNNDFASNIKPVFDACDFNGDGFVKIQDLIELGQKHSGSSGEELEMILKQLDQNGEGRVTFHEFNDKIQELLLKGSMLHAGNDANKEGIHPSEELLPELTLNEDKEGIEFLEEERMRSYTDSEGFYEEGDSNSQGTVSTTDCNEEFNNRLNTPNNFFTNAKQKTSIYSTYPPNGKHTRQGHPSLFELKRRELSRTSEYQSQEEGFEAFGECDDSILSDCGLPPLAVNMTSSPHNHRVSGNLMAHHLRQVQSARTSLHGSMEEMVAESSLHRHSLSDTDGSISYLSDEIRKLGSQLSLMKMDQESHDDKQKRIREENRMLVNRVNGLEEQLSDQKNQSLHIVEEESQKYRKELLKVQRDHTDQLDNLQIKLQEAEFEIQNLKTVEPMLRKEIEASLEERRLAQKRIEELQTELVEKEKELEQLRYKLKVKVDDLDRERNDRAEEVSLLTQEIENLKYMKTAAFNQFDEQQDLVKQLEILKKENTMLRTSEDELHIKLIEQGTKMELEKHNSLADELVTADKSDVLDALRSEETENHRLKQYIEQLLVLIMQANPLLLEK